MHVLIIGGGMAGISTAFSLRKKSKDVQITLIEPKDYVEVPWATIRGFFSPQMREKCTYSLGPWAEKHDVKHIKSCVTKLTVGEALVANGEVVKYDSCLVATGALMKAEYLGRGIYENGLQKRREDMKKAGDMFIDSGSLLVIGGGGVGCELAGDVMSFAKEANKSVKVTLVHSGDHVIPEMNDTAARKVTDQLEGAGINVITGVKAEKSGDAWKIGNETVEASVVALTTGMSSCNGFMWDEALDEKGWVKVDEYMRVDGGGNRAFALGDCCNRLNNTGVNAMESAGALASNLYLAGEVYESKRTILAVIDKMKKLEQGMAPFICLTGHKSGVAMLPFGSTTWGIPWLKNKTMFLFKAKAAMGM